MEDPLWNKKKMKFFGKQLGLTHLQVYKWKYDRQRRPEVQPKKGRPPKKVSSKEDEEEQTQQTFITTNLSRN